MRRSPGDTTHDRRQSIAKQEKLMSPVLKRATPDHSWPSPVPSRLQHVAPIQRRRRASISASATASASAMPSASAQSDDSIDDRAEDVLDDVAGEPDFPLEGFGSLWTLAPIRSNRQSCGSTPRPRDRRKHPAAGTTVPGFTVTDDALWACVSRRRSNRSGDEQITGEVGFETGQVVGRLASGNGSVWRSASRVACRTS